MDKSGSDNSSDSGSIESADSDELIKSSDIDYTQSDVYLEPEPEAPSHNNSEEEESTGTDEDFVLTTVGSTPEPLGCED